MMEQGHVTGLELDPEALEIACRSAHEMGLEGIVEFISAQRDRIPVPDSNNDALVSEFIVYPTSTPTEISQAEMARVLKPGGRMILTDVILTRPLPSAVRQELGAIGLDYLCEGTPQTFRSWMADAGLTNIQVHDLTSTLRIVWENRSSTDLATVHQPGYSYLLHDPQIGLEKTIYYLYIYGEKPKAHHSG
jgi:SAM-dependent methyltransferase